MLKAVDLRKLSQKDLDNRNKELCEELFKIKMQINLGSIKNKHAVVQKRRELAKVLTVLNEKRS